MNFKIIIVFAALFATVSLAQDDIKRNMHFGNEAFNSGDYEKAAEYYLDAVDQSPLNFKANYNLANAYYRLNKFDNAIERMNTVVNLAPTSFDKAKAYHNIGNAHIMKKDWDGAIDAYKNALRLNPSDEETRYNLAYAQQMKNKDEQKRDQDSNGGDNNMGDSNDENSGDPQENDQNQDENSNSDNQNQNQNQDQNDEQGNQGEEKDPKDGSGQQYNSKMTKEQIEQMLQEYYQREKELMKKINKDKKGGYGAPRKKDW